MSDNKEQEILQLIKERDHAEDMADQLAAKIAAITGQDIGEHSSENDPWARALDAADEWVANSGHVNVAIHGSVG